MTANEHIEKAIKNFIALQHKQLEDFIKNLTNAYYGTNTFFKSNDDEIKIIPNISQNELTVNQENYELKKLLKTVLEAFSSEGDYGYYLDSETIQKIKDYAIMHIKEKQLTVKQRELINSFHLFTSSMMRIVSDELILATYEIAKSHYKNNWESLFRKDHALIVAHIIELSSLDDPNYDGKWWMQFNKTSWGRMYQA